MGMEKILSRILPAAVALRISVWWNRSGPEARKALNDEATTLDFDMNVVPQMLPKRPPAGEAPYSVTTKMWRKIIYWARLHKARLNKSFEGMDDYLEQNCRGKVAVLGGGAFGTALATHVARQRNEVTMCIRDDGVRDFINSKHINPKYLSEFDLPENLTASTDAAEALKGCAMMIHAVPVQASRKALEAVRGYVPKGVPIVSVSKGLELGSQLLMCDLISEALGRTPEENPVVVVSGPSFAKEIMLRRPTSVVAASTDLKAAALVQRILTSAQFRVSITDDVIGVEVAGALKNVLAIAAGIVEGLGLGINAMSALICQGSAEIRWMAVKLGARPETVSGLSGMGDILLTCFGELSRNRRVGVRLGRGEPIEDILASGGGTAEGVFTAELVVEVAAKHGVLMPVLTSVARILSGEVSAKKAVFEVMSLPPLPESA